MKDHVTRFGIVGAGAISQGYAQAFQACDECEVVGVADTRKEARGVTSRGFPDVAPTAPTPKCWTMPRWTRC